MDHAYAHRFVAESEPITPHPYIDILRAQCTIENTSYTNSISSIGSVPTHLARIHLFFLLLQIPSGQNFRWGPIEALSIRLVFTSAAQ